MNLQITANKDFVLIRNDNEERLLQKRLVRINKIQKRQMAVSEDEKYKFRLAAGKMFRESTGYHSESVESNEMGNWNQQSGKHIGFIVPWSTWFAEQSYNSRVKEQNQYHTSRQSRLWSAWKSAQHCHDRSNAFSASSRSLTKISVSKIKDAMSGHVHETNRTGKHETISPGTINECAMFSWITGNGENQVMHPNSVPVKLTSDEKLPYRKSSRETGIENPALEIPDDDLGLSLLFPDMFDTRLYIPEDMKSKWISFIESPIVLTSSKEVKSALTLGSGETLYGLTESGRLKRHSMSIGLRNSLKEIESVPYSRAVSNNSSDFCNGVRIRNYTRPLERYKIDLLRLAQRALSMSKVSLIFPKSARKKVLNRLVRDNAQEAKNNDIMKSNMWKHKDKLDTKRRSFLDKTAKLCDDSNE